MDSLLKLFENCGVEVVAKIPGKTPGFLRFGDVAEPVEVWYNNVEKNKARNSGYYVRLTGKLRSAQMINTLMEALDKENINVFRLVLMNRDAVDFSRVCL